VNGYVVYSTFIRSSGVKKEDIMSHHDFRLPEGVCSGLD
jgi:hypothetical protein